MIYFAWCGAPPTAPVSLQTTGDVWGGSVTSLGTVWGGELSTVGDLLPGGSSWEDGCSYVTNLRDVAGLVTGQPYIVTGGPVPVVVGPVNITGEYSGLLPHYAPGEPGPPINYHAVVSGIGSAFTRVLNEATTFTYDGILGGPISPATLPGAYAENAGLKFVSAVGLNRVWIYDTSRLTLGDTYFISGSGIPPNTTFTWGGGTDLASPLGGTTGAYVTVSNNCTATGQNVELTISSIINQNVIRNLASVDGLVVGQSYQVFGRGIPANTLGTFQIDGTLLLTQLATVTTIQAPLQIYLGLQYPNPGAYDPTVHAVIDESILSVKIEQTEGNFALASVTMRNPYIGLLATGRQAWCWLSWSDDTLGAGAPYVPLLQGRLVGIPADMEAEVVTLQFVAQPPDYLNQQELLMTGLRVAPYYDPVWLTNGIDDPTTILEARNDRWHTDRCTLTVSISDEIIGEDGALLIGSDAPAGMQHVYSDLKVKIGNPPLSAVYVTGTVSWNQVAEGTIDITPQVCELFTKGGSIYGYPCVSAYCGEGLFTTWPKPGAGIGGGWSVNFDSTIVDYTDTFSPINLSVNFNTSFFRPIAIGEINPNPFPGTDGYAAVFPLDVYQVTMFLDYAASRPWTEVVTFFLQAGVQPILTDSRASTEQLSLRSSIIEDPIDPGGGVPLYDSRSNTYFKTPRGQQSFQWLLAYAKAKLALRARCVEITFTVPWAVAVNAGLSCRWNAQIDDPRLPGGTATGKVIAYTLVLSASEGMKASVTIGCTIGTGGAPVAALVGDSTYIDDYIDDYFTVTGGTVNFGDNTVAYENFDDFTVADDGVNFFSLGPGSAIMSLTMNGTIDQQLAAITMERTASMTGPGLSNPAKAVPDPAEALVDCYPTVQLEMVPVTGGAFLSQFPVQVSELQLPKTIDLEAAA